MEFRLLKVILHHIPWPSTYCQFLWKIFYYFLFLNILVHPVPHICISSVSRWMLSWFIFLWVFILARNLQPLFIVIVWKRALKAIVEFELFVQLKKNSHSAWNDMMMNAWWQSYFLSKRKCKIYLSLTNPIRLNLLHLTIWKAYYIILYYNNILPLFVFTMNIFVLIPSNLNKCI